MKIQETIKKQYIVKLSIGTEIKIEEDELKLVLEAMASPQRIAIKLRQGIIINQFIGAIIPDKDRVIIQKMGTDGKRTEKLLPLSDVFAGNDFIKQLGEKKLLKEGNV
jgi:hypothetical protein